VLLLKIDRASDVPAYQQICDRVVALADGGVLGPGERLPSTRKLAAAIGLHRSSVVRAYSELRALGYLESRGGSYTTIRRRQRPPTTHSGAAAPGQDSLIDWQAIARPSVRALRTNAAMETVRAKANREVIDFDRLCADPTLAPDDDLRRCIKSVLVRNGGAALDYADAAGWQPLREVIAARMCKHGAAVSPDEILVTAGAQQALDLVLRFLASAGDRIVVEAPTYGMAHSLLQLHELEPLEVPMREQGMDLDCLEHLLRGGGRRPKLVFTMPNFHNPTGITTNQQHRERLLTLCEAHGVPLVEDGFEEEMKYYGQAVLPVKSMDSNGIVLYVGTFSKVVFPGLRVGWVAAPRRATELLADIKHASCIAGNTLAQAAAAQFCTSGEFEAYLRRIHRIYRRRMRALLQGLERHMPPGVKWTRPSGGYTAWVTVENSTMAEGEMLDKVMREGVKVGPGHRYFAGRPAKTHFRLSIACVTERQIEAGCRLLGRALSRFLNSQAAPNQSRERN
jgi:DNA-binding transcriptional MocR family regulator